MPEVLPAARTLARRILLQEAGGRAEPAALAEAAARADARLRGRLADLFGLVGYTTRVDRAVRLARAESPARERGAVDAGETGAEEEGGLRGVREFARASGGDPAVAEANLSALLAHVIGLLSLFIGEDLTLRLVRDAWPELAHGPDESEGHA